MAQKVDSVGREFVVMHDVRGALVSAAASLTTGTGVTLLAADADYFLDCVEISLSNNSTVGASVTLTNDGTTIRTVQVPPGNTIQLAFDAPLRQGNKALPWIADLEDITGSTVTVEGTFIKNSGK